MSKKTKNQGKTFNIKPEAKEDPKISLANNKNSVLFCFRYFNPEIIKEEKVHKSDLCFLFLKRLQKLCDLGWDEIRKSNRHSYGMEKIHRSDIKQTLPQFITDDVDYLHVFRAKGDNTPFVGLQRENIFHVLFIEPKFGVLYDHGSK